MSKEDVTSGPFLQPSHRLTETSYGADVFEEESQSLLGELSYCGCLLLLVEDSQHHPEKIIQSVDDDTELNSMRTLAYSLKRDDELHRNT